MQHEEKSDLLAIEILMMLDEHISSCKQLPSDVNRKKAATISETSFLILNGFAMSHRYC
jgi:hypothetical protein